MKRRRKIRREGSFDEHWIRVINFPSLFFLNINYVPFFLPSESQSSSFVVFRLLNYHARKYRASLILCKYRYVINREILNEIYARKWGEGEAYKRRVN